MIIEVVRIGLMCACMNYSVRTRGVWGSRKILDFRTSEVVSDAIFE